MSLYLILILFSVSLTLIGAIFILVLQEAEEEHDEEVTMHEHLVQQKQAIESARRASDAESSKARRV